MAPEKPVSIDDLVKAANKVSEAFSYLKGINTGVSPSHEAVLAASAVRVNLAVYETVLARLNHSGPLPPEHLRSFTECFYGVNEVEWYLSLNFPTYRELLEPL